MAEIGGITLIAVARSDGFEIFTHRHRLLEQTPVQAVSTRVVPSHVA
jgi:hypothetical protein